MFIFKKIIDNLKNNRFLSIFIIFVGAYATLILINPQLAPTDDFIFLRTLQVGQPILYYSNNFPYYNAAEMGRFTPLAAMEYNIFGLFSKSPSPFFYYLYHAIQFIIFSFILVKLIKKATSNKWLIYGIPIIFSFVPGFVISHFRMQMNERNVIFFFAAFLLFYFYYLENKKWFYAVLSFLFATIAVYYKETSFIALGIFTFSHLIFTRKTSGKRIKIFDTALLFNAVSYVAIYILYILPHKMPFPGSSEMLSSQKITMLLKNIFNYTFFSDPIIILLFCLFFWRIYKVFFKKESIHPEYDSMLTAAFVYAIAFLGPLNYLMNMYGPNYMLPIYIFTFLPLVYFVFRKPLNLFWKLSIGIASFAFIFNTLPSGIHYITYYKYLPINFNKTQDFLVQNINSHHSNQRANIFLDGIDRNTGRGTYFVFADFLYSKKLKTEQFDLKSDIETQNPSPLIAKKEIASFANSFTVFNKDTADKIKTGDYLVVIPLGTYKNITNEYLQSLASDFNMVFRTNSPLAFPNLHLKSLAKYLTLRFSLADKKSSAIQNVNIMEWPDYYVFIKK